MDNPRLHPSSADHHSQSYWLVGLPAAAITVLAVVLIFGLRSSQGWVNHAQTTASLLNEVLSDLKDMETSQRGFLLTKDDRYLEPFAPASENLERNLTQLESLAGRDRRQADLARQLHKDVQEKRVEFANTIESARAGRFDLAMAVVETDRGRIQMEHIRNTVGRMRDQENWLLGHRLHHVYLMAYALAGMLVVYGGLIAYTLWQLRLRVQEVLATRSELENAYAGLEDQVRLRTRDLAAKTDELARTNQELERFAYMASHDLQEPLRKIAMMTDLLSRPAEEGAAGSRERFVAAIQADAARMRDMIVGMLNLSRIGAKEVPRARVDTAHVIDEVLKGLAVSIAEADAKIVRGELPAVYANDTQMHQLFQNLIGNALKFRVENGKARVEIGAERRDAVWLFHVRDNGIGLEEKYAARIFEAFERLHGKDRYAGSGLGLAICKKIVASNGGRIWVESMPGKGATFFFTLPAAN